MTSDINKINEQISGLEYQIARARSEIKTARVSAFRYFWPLLVLSIVGGFLAYVYSFVYFFSTPPEERVISQNVVIIAIIVVFMLIHVIGGVFARYKAEQKNRELQAEEDNQIFAIKKLDEQLVDLKYKKMTLMTGESVEESATAAPAANPFAPQYNNTSAIDEELRSLHARRNSILFEKPVPRRGSFAYFWPFMILSFVAFQATQIGMATFSELLYRMFDSSYMFYLIPGSVFAMIHIFGGIYARKKRDDYNQKVTEAECARSSEDAKLRERITELEYKRTQMLGKS